MRKISIIALVSFFFALCMVVINIALALEYKRQISELNYFAFQRFIMAVKLSNNVPLNELDEQLRPLNVKLSQHTKESVASNGEVILEDPMFDMMRYNKTLFFVPKKKEFHKPPPPPFPFEERQGFDPQHRPPPPPMPLIHHTLLLEDIGHYPTYRLWILAVVINGLMVGFFTVVLRKLLKLRDLKSAIHQFGESKVFEKIGMKNEDELGEIAHEFDSAMEKIHLLKEARTLFLRNILHELKTPIMKGKILSTNMHEEKQKMQMERIFERLETLLGEMVKVEKLASNEWTLATKEYRLVDVLDHALDLLMCDTTRIEIRTDKTASLIYVDFDLFATALKNLLDNALKYSTQKVMVEIKPYAIRVCSEGEKIPDERLDFSRAFNRSIEGASTGLGLGLYIANAIISKHHFILTYAYEKETNIFTVIFNEKNV